AHRSAMDYHVHRHTRLGNNRSPSLRIGIWSASPRLSWCAGQAKRFVLVEGLHRLETKIKALFVERLSLKGHVCVAILYARSQFLRDWPVAIFTTEITEKIVLRPTERASPAPIDDGLQSPTR